MSQPSPLLLRTPWKTIKSARYEVAILPWGATEAHNYHLPYGTDIIESDYIAAESARKAVASGARVVVLPTVPFGVNTGQLDIPLTINMNPSTQAAVLTDVVDSVSRSGIRKFVLLNSHGGNDFKQMIRELQPRFPTMLLCTINWWQIVDQADFFDARDDHAGEMETSAMLAIAPESVLPLSVAGKGSAKQFRIEALQKRWAWTPRQWTKVTSDTGVGDPSKATAEKGRKYLEAVTSEIAGFLKDLSGANPGDLYR